MDLPDDTLRLTYLLVLLAVMLLWFGGDFRRNLNRNLQSAAIWVLIFLGFIAAYGFRDVLGLQLLTGAPEIAADGSATVARAADGHFYLQLGVNGENITFLIDTGASAIVLNRRDAARVGLDPDRLDYSETALTANGEVASAPVKLSRLEGAGIVLRDIAAFVNGGELDTSLLGMDYIRRFGTVTIEGDRLTFAP
jgi:aspartyl protease family protein